ncbi:MAG TPA: hypothetical protein VGK10_10215, partial [Prolixibacteraceae bacterium]
MKNKFITYIAGFSMLVSSCGTAHKQVKSTVQAKQASQEADMSEDNKNEFEYTFIEGLKQKMIGNQPAAVTLFSKCLEINHNSSSAM